MLSSRLILPLLIGGVVAVVLVAHWPAMTAKAITFDDREYLLQNELVQHPGWTSAGRFLGEVLTPSTVRGYYQPLAMISLMLDAAMGGRPDNLEPFHRTSLLLHLINTALVVVLLQSLFHRPWIAALVGLLFGVHPMTVEPIPWVGERKTLLAAFFALWCLILYVRYAHKGGKAAYGLSLACYALALLSKPTATTLPLGLLVLDFWPLQRLSKRAVLEKAPFFAVAAVSAVITFISQARTARADLPGDYGLWRIPLLLGHNIFFYLYKMVWPVGLSPHYPLPEPLSLSNGMILTGVIVSPLLIAALLLSLYRTRALLAGWLFFFILIFPTMGVIGFTISIASDKYAYLPVVGLLITLAWLCTRAVEVGGNRKIAQGVTAGAAAVVVIVLGVLSRGQLAHWQTTDGLYEYMLGITPKASVLHFNYGVTLADSGRFPQAIEHYEAALRLRPDMIDGDNNLGIALAQVGRPAEAIEHLKHAIQISPYDPKGYNNLGNVYASQGKLDEAIATFKKALELDPRLAKTEHNLGLSLAGQGKHEEAIEHYRKALEIAGDSAETHAMLGLELARSGQTAEAVRHLSEAVRLNPGDGEARRELERLRRGAGGGG